jgi:hypothetical protein
LNVNLPVTTVDSKQFDFTNVFSKKVKKGKAVSPVTGLAWPTGFQEVKVPGFHDNGTGWW